MDIPAKSKRLEYERLQKIAHTICKKKNKKRIQTENCAKNKKKNTKKKNKKNKKNK